MFIKICGLSTEKDVQAAISAGADALGFVFASSPRKISPDRALSLCKNIGDHIIFATRQRNERAVAGYIRCKRRDRGFCRSSGNF